MRSFLLFFSSLVLLPAQTLTTYSGNGQIVQEQFLSTAPLTVQARDASGHAVAGVMVNWSITQGLGTLLTASGLTDANGLASTLFLATSLNPGSSLEAEAVTAASSFGSAVFNITTAIARLPGGGFAAPPLTELLTPSPDNRVIVGSAGSILPAAVVIRVTSQSGAQSGQPVPNVGVRIVPNPDPAQPTASCNGPGGTVLTDARGLATCDLVLGAQTGVALLNAIVGEAQNTPTFSLQVTRRVPCSYTITPTTQSFGAAAANGSVNISTGANCAWTAGASDPWIMPAQASGTGSGVLAYAVAANSGAARTGSLTVSGQTLTITQAAVSGVQPVQITTSPALPLATAGAAYSTQLSASGGSGQYTWTLYGTLPAGLSLSPTGLVTGTPTAAGSFSFSIGVTSSGDAGSPSQTFTLTVLGASGQLAITNSAFPNGVTGQAYQQILTSTVGCTTPFSQVPTFRLIGGTLPPGLSVQSIADRTFAIAGTPTANGTYSFTLSATDACGATATANLSITVGTTQGSVLVSTPSSLTFNGTGSANLALTSATPVNYSATAATASGGGWLTLTSVTGTTPGSIAVTANAGQLPAGTYTGSVTIAGAAGANPVIVPVTLVVGVATLTALPVAISATLSNTGSTLAQQTLSIGSSGASVPFTAVAELAGSPSSAWLTVAPPTGTAPAAVQVTLNAAGLAPGTYAGDIRISTANSQLPALVVPVALTVLASATLQVSPASLSFTAVQGGAVSQPQTVTVASSGSGVAFNVVVPALAGAGWIQVVPTTGTAPASFTVTANPAGFSVGTYTGLITVQSPNPLIATVSLPVTLTVTAPAAPTLSSVTNAASFAPGALAPGEFVTLFGTLLGPGSGVSLMVDASGNITSLNSGTRVLFDQIPASILYTSAGQVSAIVPFEVAGRASAIVQVEYQGVRSNPVNIRVADTNPAVFTLDSLGQGAILNQNGGINSSTNRAMAGTVVSIFATGAGLMSPSQYDGQISGVDLRTLPSPPQVLIGTQQAAVLYAGSAPGLPAGLVQINVRIPAGTPSGDRVPVVVSASGVSGPTVYMGVQ